MPLNNRVSRRAILHLLAAASIGVTALDGQSEGGNCQPDHVAWVADSVKRMLSIKPGMIRCTLMHVFSPENGADYSLQGVFVSRDCRYFKVNVTLRSTERSMWDTRRGEWFPDPNNDVIVTITQPYLQINTTN